MSKQENTRQALSIGPIQNKLRRIYRAPLQAIDAHQTLSIYDILSPAVEGVSIGLEFKSIWSCAFTVLQPSFFKPGYQKQLPRVLCLTVLVLLRFFGSLPLFYRMIV
jgi:hypothetical protein